MKQKLAHPLFIVGSPRSGTSIIVDAFLAAGYSGYLEGNFLSCLRGIEKSLDWHFKAFGSDNPKVMTTHIDLAALKKNIFRTICDAAAEVNSMPPWLDKTGNPEMMEAIPTLLDFWPNSHFVFVKRRGIENILSRVRKFPQFSFKYHCEDWVRNMSVWRRMKSEIQGLRFIEIDQRDISFAPSESARRLCEFVQIGPVGQERMIAMFENAHPQQTEEGSHARVASLETTGWSRDEIDLFTKICEIEMTLWGYTTDVSYFK